MNAELIKNVVIESYKANVVSVVRPYVPRLDTDRVFDFMLGVFVVHTLLMWTLTRMLYTAFPRSFEAVRSLIITAVCVFIFWMVYIPLFV